MTGELKGTMKSATPSHLTCLQEYSDNGGYLKSQPFPYFWSIRYTAVPLQKSTTKLHHIHGLPTPALSQTTIQNVQTFVELFPNASQVSSLSKSSLSVFVTDVRKGRQNYSGP